MKLTVEGMTCGHCVRAITHALERIGARANVDLAGGTVTVDGTEDVAAARDAIERAGYAVTDVVASSTPVSPHSAAPGRCCGSART